MRADEVMCLCKDLARQVSMIEEEVNRGNQTERYIELKSLFLEYYFYKEKSLKEKVAKTLRDTINLVDRDNETGRSRLIFILDLLAMMETAR